MNDTSLTPRELNGTSCPNPAAILAAKQKVCPVPITVKQLAHLDDLDSRLEQLKSIIMALKLCSISLDPVLINACLGSADHLVDDAINSAHQLSMSIDC